ncbi:MAG: PAM68 family protein [Cyanobacteriota bacterium]
MSKPVGKSSRYSSKVSSKTSRRRSAPSSAAAPVEKESLVPIPPEVSRRMVRRMLIFCGIPSGIGLSSFFVNYYLLVNHVVALPSYFTLVESLACFGLGFLGISYGVFSASWDPEPGSLLGIGEFRRNLGNTLKQWRAFAAPDSSDSGETSS